MAWEIKQPSEDLILKGTLAVYVDETQAVAAKLVPGEPALV